MRAKAVSSGGIHGGEPEANRRALLCFYYKRGAAEQKINKGKQAIFTAESAIAAASVLPSRRGRWKEKRI
jgi:hypothetical protein